MTGTNRDLWYLVALLSLGALLAPAQTRRVAVIAHRGEHLRHPENTVPALHAAIAAGADFVEVDVRTTADGRLVLMHDATVNRMTNGTGEVAAMTFAHIQTLDAGARFPGEFSGTRVPEFQEALTVARGRIGVYIDSKRVSASDLIAAVERAGMQDHVVIYGGPALLRDIADVRPKWRVMPEAQNPEMLSRLIRDLSARVAAFDAKDFNAPTISIALAAGVEIFVDRLGPADQEAGWQDAIDRGVAGIQTDHPAELVSFLRARGLHK